MLVDKDLKEIASIKSCMPDTSIKICKFHVLQAISWEIRKTPISESERKILISTFRKLVYARTEDAFEEKLAYLTRQASTDLTAY